MIEQIAAAEARHKRKTGRCVYCDVLEGERGGERTVLRDELWIACVPAFARWPYEVHLAPIRHRGDLLDLDDDDDESFARILKGLLQKYDRLFDRPLPYVMAMHQKPPGRGAGHHHFHVEFYPANRTKDKLKYLAGSAIAARALLLHPPADDTPPQLRGIQPRSPLPRHH